MTGVGPGVGRYERVPLSSLTRFPGNPRRGDVGLIAASLSRRGQYKPLVVSSDSVVLAGNHTLAAAESLGWDEVDVWRLPVPSGDVRAAEIVAVDNRASDVGGYDAADLLALLDLIGDPGDVGWSGDDLAELTRLDPVGAADVLERDPGRSDALAAPKWLVVVDCGGASEQEALYERLRADGLKVRVAVA